MALSLTFLNDFEMRMPNNYTTLVSKNQKLKYHRAIYIAHECLHLHPSLQKSC